MFRYSLLGASKSSFWFCLDLEKLNCVIFCIVLIKKNGPTGQQSDRRLATTSRDDSEANWNGQADRRMDRTTY